MKSARDQSSLSSALLDGNRFDRISQLHRVESSLKEFYENRFDGLRKVIGPSLGILRENDVLGIDGDIIGHAVKRSTFPSNFGEIVVELDPESEWCASQDATYGLADSSGFVFPAVISAVGGQILLEDFERNGGESNGIGRMVWKPMAADHVVRVLVMGGAQKNRDRFLQRYAGVEEFEYERCAARAAEDISKLEDLIRRNGQFSAKRAIELHKLRSKLSKLSKSFKIISSSQNESPNSNFSELANEEVHRQFPEMADVKLSDLLNSPSEPDQNSIVESQAISRIVKAMHKQPSWPLLEEDAALCLLYCGATASSPLGQYGRAPDFIEAYSNHVRAGQLDDDSSRYFTGEILVSKRHSASPHLIKLPHSVILINAPDIRADDLGPKACGRELWEKIGHRVPAILAACQQLDTTQTETVSRSKFIDLVGDICPQCNESEALKLLEFLSIDDSGRVSYGGLQILCGDPKTCESPYDLAAAIEILAEISDVIIFLQYGNISKFNDVESENLRRVYDKFHSKLHIHCIDNHELRSDISSCLSDVLHSYPLAKSVSMSSTHSAALEFLNSVVNEQQVRLLSLLSGLKYDVDNLMRRLDFLYARADRGTDLDHVIHLPFYSIVDGHAVAAANAMLVEACRRAKRLLGAMRGQPLLEHLSTAFKTAKRNAADLLARCGCVVLTISERYDRWSALAAHQEAVIKAVNELDLALWVTDAFLECWLRVIGVRAETRAVLRKERIRDVFSLMALDSSTMSNLGVPLRDRVLIMSGLEVVRRRFQQLRAEYARDGLWRLVQVLLAASPQALWRLVQADGGKLLQGSGHAEQVAGIVSASPQGEEYNRENSALDRQPLERQREDTLLVQLDPNLLYDQEIIFSGNPVAKPTGKPIKTVSFVRNCKDQDKVMVEVSGYGRVLVSIPCWSDSARPGFELRPDKPNGGAISAEGLGLLYCVLDGAVENEERRHRWLEDGIDMFVTGDVPPLVLLEMARNLLLELGHAAPTGGGAAEEWQVYSRRWALDAMLATEKAPESDSDREQDESDGTAEMSLVEAGRRAASALDQVFDAVAEGRVTADGSRLEVSVYRNKSLMALLRRLGLHFLPGRVAVLREIDVLRREFVDGVLCLD